jgi:hypothetical protein
MDGFAVRAADTVDAPVRLTVTGTLPAGGAMAAVFAPEAAVSATLAALRGLSVDRVLGLGGDGAGAEVRGEAGDERSEADEEQSVEATAS